MDKTNIHFTKEQKIVVNGFPLGVQYFGPPHTSEKDWQRDFPLIKEHGLDIIVVWAIWGHLEPSPNQYYFTAWDRMFNVAHDHGLKIIANTTIEIQPYWIHRYFPEAYMLDQRGSKIVSTTGEYAGGNSPGTCLDHKKPREQAERFLTNFAAHFKDRENLFGWDVWCELRWMDNADDFAMGTSHRNPCYCERTVDKFRQWLKSKYGSIDGLNAQWRHKHTDWVDVYPPRGGWWSYGFPETVDWGEFIIDNTVDKLQLRVDAVRKGDPKHFIMNHTNRGSVINDWFCRNGSDDWQNAKVVDIYGTSFYPVWQTSASELNCMELDDIRSATQACGKAFWISELQGGPALHSPGKGKNYSSEELKLWSYCTLAHGAKGLLYWSWRPEPFGPEAQGFGITTFGGIPTARTRMVKEVVHSIKQHEALLADAKPYPAHVAILFEPDTYNINYYGGTGGMEPGMVMDSMHGYYKALWQNDIPTDFVHSTDMDKLEQYKLLILPFAFCLRANVAKAIKAFVQAGGTVLSEAYLGRYSEGCVPATTCPTYGLHELFQVQTTEAEFIESTYIVPAGKQELFRGVDALTGYWFKEHPVLLEGAEVLAMFQDGIPALTRSRIGMGQTLLFGALMGFGYNKAGKDQSLSQLIGNIVKEAGVIQPVKVTSSDDGLVRARILKNGKNYLIFCLNYGAECSAKFKINLPMPFALKNLITDLQVDYSIVESKIELELQMAAKEANILLYSIE